MAILETTLRPRDRAAEGTLTFALAKPAGFTFTAGQFVRVGLVDPPETDAEGNRRLFSIASAPHEPDLLFATRLRDTAFKRVLRDLPGGSPLTIEGPYGVFTLHADATRPAVFLMGGIGITPARSIILDATHRNLPHQLFLFYANRRPEDAAFLSELASLKKTNPRYTFVGTMSEMEKSRKPWTGERGYITSEMLARHLPDLGAPIYYIAGPPAMVRAMRKILEGARIPSAQIRTEEFSGY